MWYCIDVNKNKHSAEHGKRDNMINKYELKTTCVNVVTALKRFDKKYNIADCLLVEWFGDEAFKVFNQDDMDYYEFNNCEDAVYTLTVNRFDLENGKYEYIVVLSERIMIKDYCNTDSVITIKKQQLENPYRYKSNIKFLRYDYYVDATESGDIWDNKDFKQGMLNLHRAMASVAYATMNKQLKNASTTKPFRGLNENSQVRLSVDSMNDLYSAVDEHKGVYGVLIVQEVTMDEDGEEWFGECFTVGVGTEYVNVDDGCGNVRMFKTDYYIDCVDKTLHSVIVLLKHRLKLIANRLLIRRFNFKPIKVSLEYKGLLIKPSKNFYTDAAYKYLDDIVENKLNDFCCKLQFYLDKYLEFHAEVGLIKNNSISYDIIVRYVHFGRRCELCVRITDNITDNFAGDLQLDIKGMYLNRILIETAFYVNRFLYESVD